MHCLILNIVSLIIEYFRIYSTANKNRDSEVYFKETEYSVTKHCYVARVIKWWFWFLLIKLM